MKPNSQDMTRDLGRIRLCKRYCAVAESRNGEVRPECSRDRVFDQTSDLVGFGKDPKEEASVVFEAK